MTQLGLQLEQERPAMKESLRKVYEMLRLAGSRGCTSADFANAYCLRYAAPPARVEAARSSDRQGAACGSLYVALLDCGGTLLEHG
jgi:hypothetical protein